MYECLHNTDITSYWAEDGLLDKKMPQRLSSTHFRSFILFHYEEVISRTRHQRTHQRKRYIFYISFKRQQFQNRNSYHEKKILFLSRNRGSCYSGIFFILPFRHPRTYADSINIDWLMVETTELYPAKRAICILRIIS